MDIIAWVTTVFARACLLTLVIIAQGAVLSAQATSDAPAQAPAAPPAPTWTFRLAAAGYFLPDDGNYVQPTVTANRGALHLESRYSYEERNSLSAFVGWTFGFGSRFRFDLTPMFGVVAGERDGVMPGLELSFTAGPVEFYSEGEYVIDVHDTSDRFLYNWSELSVWPVEWLRVGLVTQRTRVFNEPRDVQRGLLGGVAIGRFEGVAYWFNPGSSDRYFVTSFAISF
jgi:hypothetical protein